MNATVRKSAPAGLALVTGAGLMAIITGAQGPQVVPIPQADGGDFSVEDFAGDEFQPEYLAFCAGEKTCAHPAVTVYFTGRVEMGEGVTLDDASLAFWSGLTEKFPVVRAQLCHAAAGDYDHAGE